MEHVEITTDDRILVTGGEGFLGKHVCTALTNKGFRRWRTVSHDDFDLTDYDDVTKVFDESRVEIVIHLAANCGGIGKNAQDPGEMFYDNMQMGLNLIHKALLHGVKKFVMVGTCCSYPECCPTPFREDDLWSGYPEPTNAPYGVAKRALWTMLDAYKQAYGRRSIYLILANLYGPGDNFDPETSHVIPALIRKFCSGEDPATIWGTGKATREFLYVEDAADAIVYMMQHRDDHRPINISSGEGPISISALLNVLFDVCEFKGSIHFDTDKPDGQLSRCLDTSKQRAMGWQPKTMLGEGLRKTVEWWRQHGCAKPSSQA